METVYDMVVIGGGIGGYSAALYASRFKLKTLVLTQEKGGRLQLTHLIENYPGTGPISGFDLMQAAEKQATQFGGEIKVEKVKGVTKEGKLFVTHTEANNYKSKTVIIATGIERRTLNIPGEKEFQNKGVSFCATCDGALFRGKTVAVIGGADSAIKEALLLTDYAKKVYVVYRGEKIRPEPITMEQIEKKVKEGKVEIVTNTNLTEITGNKLVNGIVLDRPYKGSNKIAVEGVFIEVGGTPGSSIAQGLGVELDKKGSIIVDTESKTNVPGFFAAGDVTNSKWKQGIIAASQGSFAAFSAYSYIMSTA